MILKPLQRVQVLESTKKFKPGSLGYFVAQDRVGSYNMWDMCIVFTRFGKKGKARIEPASVRHYMIDYGTMRDSDRKIMDVVKVHEKIEPVQYKNERGGRISILGEIESTKIEPFPMDSKNLLDLSDKEFTAYIVAISMFIHKMIYSKGVQHLVQSPSIKSREFVESDFDLGLPEPGSIGYYILYGLQYDIQTKRADMPRKHFGELYNYQISTEAKKTDLLDRLHRDLAMAKDSIKKYEQNTEIALKNSSTKINNVLKHYRKYKEELKQVEEGKRLSRKGPYKNWYAEEDPQGAPVKLRWRA